MTDLLIRDPEDTGDIPTGVGERTENLAPYVHGLAPALRRPTAVLDLIGGCRRIDPNDDDFVKPGQPQPPQPLPDPTPPPQPEQAYVGRHRAPEDTPADVPPGRFGWLRSVLATAWQRIAGAL